jgi:hypothetical protein
MFIDIGIGFGRDTLAAPWVACFYGWLWHLVYGFWLLLMRWVFGCMLMYLLDDALCICSFTWSVGEGRFVYGSGGIPWFH